MQVVSRAAAERKVRVPLRSICLFASRVGANAVECAAGCGAVKPEESGLE
jgi:hypothetical protein